MRHQSEKPEPQNIRADQNGPRNLVALPSSTLAVFVTVAIAVMVAIALFLLTYLGIQTLRSRTTRSNGSDGLTKAELLDARANPMLMESDVGVSAAIVSLLERVCNGLPAPSERKECGMAIYPGPKPEPQEVAKSSAVHALTDSESQEDPKIGRIKFSDPVTKNAPLGWNFRWISYSVSQGGGENTGIKPRILWFRPQDKVRKGCWYQNPASEDSYKNKTFARSIAKFFEHLGHVTSSGGLNIPGLGTGKVGRAYIMFPTGDIMIWVPLDQRSIGDELSLFGRIPRPCLINRSVYFSPLPPERSFQYTGVYLDSAGLGINATVFARRKFAEQLSVAAIDLTFDPNVLAGRTGNLTELVSLPSGVNAKWENILDGLDRLKRHDLRGRVEDCLKSDAVKDSANGRLLTCSAHPLSLNGSQDNSTSASSEGSHAIAVFLGQSNLGESKWLVASFPSDEPGTGLINGTDTPKIISFQALRTIYETDSSLFLSALIALCLVGSVVWLSVQHLKYHVTLRTLLSMLNTMNVPLIVSDPNSDYVGVGNEAAKKMGLAPVEHFGPEVVDIEDQERYKGTQTPGRVRAYVVRIRVRNDAEARYALFRSAPVDSKPGYLNARRGDRLSVILPMNPNTDLDSLSHAIDNTIRFRFAHLLDHGVLAWTRVLESIIEKDRQLAATLVKLIQRNQTFISSLFSWDESTTALPRDVEALDEQSIHFTVDLCKALFAAASADEDIRRSLNLVNGTLSGSRDGNASFELQQTAWPEGAYIRVSMKGALGFFLGEGLRNAIRHGKPGTTPKMTITVDGSLQFVRFEIRNEITLSSRGEKKSLGGIELMRDGAKFLHWRFDAGPEVGRAQGYLCWWEIPLVRHSQA